MVAQGRYAQAIETAETLLATTDDRIDLLRALGEAAVRAGDTVRAGAAWRHVLESHADDPEALFHLGSLARAAGDAHVAIEYLERARRAAPSHAAVLNNLALALEAAGALGEAEVHLRAAVASAPDAFEPLANLAQNLFRQRRYGEALDGFERVVSRFAVSDPAVWANRAVCLRAVGRRALAASSFERAVALSERSPADALLLEYGLLEVERHRFSAAAQLFERLLAARPDSSEALCGLLFCRQNLADWRGFEPLRARVLACARALDGRGNDPVPPYNVLTISDDPALACAVAREWARTRVAGAGTPPPLAPGTPLRIAFVSSDFYEHPVGRLIVDLIERIDRRRFHVTLVAIGASRDDAIARRLVAAADAFHASEVVDGAALAKRIRAGDIDVLFDLGGYTAHAPVELFAARPAPLQAGFLGFTGTMGSAAYDFIVADRYCIPPASAPHYAETPLYIDPCYLPSDSRRTLGPVPDRIDYGLPGDAIVLCAFANTYKILPAMFDAWMSLLVRHPRALLWLRDAGEEVNLRLREEARARNVDATRLAFAPKEPPARYLARFRLADLFVDTSPFGAHTTLNDALFAGLPAVSIEGRTFAARASASQLRAAGLEALVAGSVDDYVRIADRLIANPGTLRALAERLRAAAAQTPLFDMDRYTRAFERAIEGAVEARCAGAK